MHALHIYRHRTLKLNRKLWLLAQMPQTLTNNIHEYTVSELSGAVKRSIEDNFGFVRVRGELGRVTRAGSGHVYLDLKDDRAVLSSVMWKGMAARLSINPEQGMEVVATGKLSTFPGQSRYQLIIDSLEPAGVGALMALYEERKKKLAAEGLFAPERKKPLPFLPDVIGVVTSPSGAVIRDILHRLRERFPRHVIVWPTLVQGRGAEEKIAAAIKGFNALKSGGAVPRPDLLIVARGGGSLEDLWCFNEEVVARAAAASEIPLISAVGHETDTTLIDYAADKRAPTPTAAAEMAAPVRSELVSEVLNKQRRISTTVTRSFDARREALRSADRGLGRPEDILGAASQSLDRAADRLRSGLRTRLDQARLGIAAASGRLAPGLLSAGLNLRETNAQSAGARLTQAANALAKDSAAHLATISAQLSSSSLSASLSERRNRVENAGARLRRTAEISIRDRSGKLSAAARLLGSVSYENVLKRGFTLVRDKDGAIIRAAKDPENGAVGELQFFDGIRAIRFGDEPPSARPQKKLSKPKATPPARQQRLFD